MMVRPAITDAAQGRLVPGHDKGCGCAPHLLLVVTLLGGIDRLAAQEAVEARGITPSIKLEEVVYGHMEEINGKFKMRATEVTLKVRDAACLRTRTCQTLAVPVGADFVTVCSNHQAVPFPQILACFNPSGGNSGDNFHRTNDRNAR
jgi:hypothetical protein